jgi:chorismate dehydratase
LEKKIKVGIVSYLNARPLIYGLKLPPIKNKIELIEDTPAELARMLSEDIIDVGLIPVASILSLPEYHIVGDYCIAADGEVASVCLFSEVPMDKIEKIYLDYQSRSSAELLKWLLKEYWGIHPIIIESKNEDYRQQIKGTTAGLVIGDRALEQRKISTYIYDLGAAWRSKTGLPIVFAAWISKRLLPQTFIKEFDEANAVGLNFIDEIVKDHPLEIYDLKKYYTVHIQYKLDERKRQGLKLFLQAIN